MLRRIGAVLAGYAAIAALVMLTDFVVAAIRPGEYISGQVPPAYYFVVSSFTAPLYALAGGYLCASIGRLKPWWNVTALVVFGEVMGVAATVMFWARQPWWYGLYLLAIYPPAVWLGGYVRLRRSERGQTS